MYFDGDVVVVVGFEVVVEVVVVVDFVDFEDVDAQQKLITRQEELNDKIINKQDAVNKMYRQAIENEYYSAIDGLLSLPENFQRLTTPNSSSMQSSLELK